MSKVSKIDQIHIRVVMLCMSKTSKILKQPYILFDVGGIEID